MEKQNNMRINVSGLQRQLDKIALSLAEDDDPHSANVIALASNVIAATERQMRVFETALERIANNGERRNVEKGLGSIFAKIARDALYSKDG